MTFIPNPYLNLYYAEIPVLATNIPLGDSSTKRLELTSTGIINTGPAGITLYSLSGGPLDAVNIDAFPSSNQAYFISTNIPAKPTSTSVSMTYNMNLTILSSPLKINKGFRYPSNLNSATPHFASPDCMLVMFGAGDFTVSLVKISPTSYPSLDVVKDSASAFIPNSKIVILYTA